MKRLFLIWVVACLSIGSSVEASTLSNLLARWTRQDKVRRTTYCEMLLDGSLAPLEGTGLSQSDLQAFVDFGYARKADELLGFYAELFPIQSERFQGMADELTAAEPHKSSRVGRLLRDRLLQQIPWQGAVPSRLSDFLPQQFRGVSLDLPRDFEPNVRSFIYALGAADFERVAGDYRSENKEPSLIRAARKDRRKVVAEILQREIVEISSDYQDQEDDIESVIHFVGSRLKGLHPQDGSWLAKTIFEPMLSRVLPGAVVRYPKWTANEAKSEILARLRDELVAIRDQLHDRLRRGRLPRSAAELSPRQQWYRTSVLAADSPSNPKSNTAALVSALPEATEFREVIGGALTQSGDLEAFNRFWNSLSLKERVALWTSLRRLLSRDWAEESVTLETVLRPIPTLSNAYLLRAAPDESSLGRVVLLGSESKLVILAWYRDEVASRSGALRETDPASLPEVRSRYQQSLLNP